MGDFGYDNKRETPTYIYMHTSYVDALWLIILGLDETKTMFCYFSCYFISVPPPSTTFLHDTVRTFVPQLGVNKISRSPHLASQHQDISNIWSD